MADSSQIFEDDNATLLDSANADAPSQAELTPSEAGPTNQAVFEGPPSTTALFNQSYFSTPDRSSPLVKVTIPSGRINQRPTGKGSKARAASFPKLVIGFDTEYQTGNPIGSKIEDAKHAQNQLLSYQFCVRLLEVDATRPTLQSKGIIIPDSGARWNLRDFVAAAIGTLLAEHPTANVPTDIYLVGHFTRADLPMFRDIDHNARRFWNNIRSTFASIDESMPMWLVDDDNSDIAKFDIVLRDTILLAPEGKKSLEQIGEMLGLKKLWLSTDHQPASERSAKANMRQLMLSNWLLFRDYAIRDAEICAEYAERVIRTSQQLFGDFKMPVTLTQFGSKLLIADWENAGKNPDELLGRESVTEIRYNAKLGVMISRKERPYVHEVHDEQDLVTATYHGGRNEQFLFGICDEGIWRDHDLSSAYATAMALIGKPDWANMQRHVDIDEIGPLDLAFVYVDFEFPATVRFPTLPVRTANGIIFPRKGMSQCGAPELALAKALGAKLKLRKAVRVTIDHDQQIFVPFIRHCLEQRGQHKKGTFENLFWKQVGNSTYGKTAQGLRSKRVYDLREDDMVDLPESTLTQPFFASFITSFVRTVLGEIINGFPQQVQVFSVTTDGFLSNANDQQIAQATAGYFFNVFRQARQNLAPDDQALEIKHTIRQPLGWRTRGSATLKPGDDGAGFVTQKGGIKLAELDLSPEEENARTVELFFNRYPDQKLVYTSGVGLKTMVRQHADYVFRTIERKLSMEFDFKRRPKIATDRTTEFNGKTYTHLTFETEPLQDIEEFQRFRDVWGRYTKNSHVNLKTVADLDRFLNAVTLNRVAGNEVARYLSKSSDGDLKRARRDLARAFRHFQAGFDKIHNRLGKIRHGDFCDALESVGIPCTIDDLDNAKRQIFEPHKTVRTDRVVDALEKLKSEFWPELEINTFLTTSDNA